MKYIKSLYTNYNFFLKDNDYIKNVEIDQVTLSNNLDVVSKDFKVLVETYKNFGEMFPKVKNYNFKDQNVISNAFMEILNKENFLDIIDNYGKKYITSIFISFVSEKNYLFETAFNNMFKNIRNEEEKKEIIEYILTDLYNELIRFFRGYSHGFQSVIIKNKIIDDRIEKMIEDIDSMDFLVEYYIKNKGTNFKELEYKILKAVEKSNNLISTIRGVNLYVEYKKPIQRWEEFEKLLIDRIKDDPRRIYMINSVVSQYINLTKFNWDKFNLLVLNRAPFQGNISELLNYFSSIIKYISPDIRELMIKSFEEYFKNPQPGAEIYFFKSYCFDILKARWKEKEDDIIFNPELYKDANRGIFDILFDYIKKFKIKDVVLHSNIMKKIKRNGTLASLYTVAINQPVPELEPVLAKGYTTAYRYATKVLKARFPLGEPKILASRKANDYRKRFGII
jgi:hypothetical protein